jgi:hypothetical protein
VYYDLNNLDGDQWTSILPVSSKAQTGSSGASTIAWAIPSTVTNNARIKIEDAADAANTYHIGSLFSVGAQFDITGPENGAAVYAENTTTKITWATLKGTGISKVHLQYSNNSEDATPTWINITDPTPTTGGVANTGEYTWNPIPRALADISTTTHRVRILQHDPSNSDPTTVNIGGGGVFPILGALTVTVPSGGESWGVNTTRTIQFTKKGDLQSADLYYSKTGNAIDYVKITGTPINISDATGGASPYSYAWFLDPVATNLTSGFTGKIKAVAVTPASQTSVAGEQTGNIEVKGSVTLNTPSATSIVLDAGAIYSITWSKFGAVNNVELHYSTTGGIAGGGTYPAGNIITTVPSTPSSFNWDVPNAISPNVRVRVRDANNSNVWDESDNVFRIKGKIAVTEPDIAGISWFVGSTQLVKWTSTGTFSPVEIHYDRDGDFVTTTLDTFPILPLSTVANCTPVNPAITCNGQANWSVPDKIGATVKARVRGTGSETDVQDISANNFKIIGKLDVLSPESGQVWYIGDTTRQITWDATGTVTNVKIGYKTSAGGVCTWITVDDGGHTSGANSYNWASVANVKTETAYICLADKNFESETIVYSNNAFSIRPKITVIEPLGGTRLKVANNYPNAIKWSITGTQTSLVEIRYSMNGGVDNYPATQTIATLVDVTQGGVGIAWNNIPDKISNNATLKIFDLGQSLVEGVSAASFKIVGSVFNVQIRNTTDTQDISQLKYGQNYLIKWQSTGSTPFDNVSVWYTVHNELGLDTYPLQIVSTTPRATGSYVWNNVPVPLSNDAANQSVVIRVADFNDPLSRGLSPSVKIQSVLDVTQPEDNTIILASGTQDYQIKWNTTGWEAGDQVLVQYQVNGGAWTNAESNSAQPYANASGVNTFLWDIPTTQSVISNNVKVRVVDNGDPTNINESTQFFAIRAGLDVTSPDGNADPNLTEAWTVGTTQTVKWTLVGYMNTVKLQYSVNGGLFTQIPGAVGLTATAGATGFAWNIPDNISNQVRVRVVNEVDTAVYADSAYDFKIQGKLDFSPALPQGGDAIWYVGQTKTIAWTKIGTIPTVKLQYSLDGTNYSDITGATSLSGTTFNWQVPDIIDPAINVRAINTVIDGTKPTTPAVSANIEVKGQLSLDAPVLNDIWQVDNTYNIRWKPTGTMSTVKLEYSKDGFVSGLQNYAVLGPAGQLATSLPAGTSGVQQSFTWKIPNNIGNTVTVRVTNNADGTVYGNSGIMKIAGGLKLLTPNGGVGQFFNVDRSTPITWELHGTVANVDLQYSTNGFINESQVFPIVTRPATDLSYSWTIPNAIGSAVKVRVKDNAGAAFTIADASDQNFEIRGELEFNATNSDSPLGPEIWLIDETHALKWTKHGTISAAKVEYKVGAGAYAYVKDPAGTQATSVAGNTFVWRIPDQKGIDNVIVKVTNLSDPNVYIESNPITIRGGFAWTNPSTTNQVIFVNSTEVLSWTAFGTIPNVDLKFSTSGIGGTYNFMQKQAGGDADNVANCTPISPSLNCNATFNWNIPNNISKTVYVKIEDSTDPDAVQIFGPIKIAGKIYVDEPDNNPEIERWGVGTSQDIRWTMDGTIPSLKIEYSLNGGTDWVIPAISDSIVGSLLVKNWSIGASVPVSPNVAIRLSDTDTQSGTPAVLSPVFKIVGSFTVGVPTQAGSSAGILRVVENGEITPAVANATISWTTAGNVPLVDVYYSTTGNVGDWTKINGAAIADGGNGGSISWAVPDVITTTMRIRVQDNADPDTKNDSALFTVRGDFKLTSPVGGEKWGVSGSVPSAYKTVSWQRNGSVAQVYLDYSTSGATGPWIPIESSPGVLQHANSGSIAWNVPDNMSTTARIRLRNVSGPAIENITPADFKIMARFDVTYPDGGEILTAGQNATLTWNKWGAGALNVRIELATNGNQPTPTYADIFANTPNDSSQLWLVDVNKVTPNAKIRISDVNDPDSANASVNPFVIRASFVLDPLIGSADLKVADTFQIFWTKQGNIPTVLLEYSPDNFFADTRKINGTDGLVPNTDSCTSDPTKGCYVWSVPDIEDNKDTGIKFRVSDPNDPSAVGISNTFNIIPKLTLTSPNGNVNPNLTEKWFVGTTYNITWTSSSAIAKTPQVTISYTTTGGAPYSNPITTTANDGSFTWVSANGGVPDTISSQVRIRIQDASDNVALDDSDNNLKIISNFTLLTPNTTVAYQVDDTINITWTNIGTVNNVELAYSTASTDFSLPKIIQATTPNDGSYIWTFPNDISQTVRVRVRSLTDDGNDISNADFRIRGKLNITAPVLSQAVQIGNTFTIQWNTTGTIPNVNLVYDTNDGAGGYPYSIATNLANCTPVQPATTCSHSFNWPNVPDTPTALGRIKIIDSRPAENDVINVSPRFNIVGNFTLTAPNGNEDWRVGSTHNITWTWGGTIPVVKLFYAVNGTQANPTWQEIDPLVTKNYSLDGLPQNGANNTVTRSYTWTIPNNITTAAKVRIEDASNNTVGDNSNNIFKIRGAFTVLTPNGNANVSLTDRWVTNDIKTITWTSQGTMPFVKLEYSNDNFVSNINPIIASTANDGSYDWVIPDAVLKGANNSYTNYNLVKVRVSDVNDGQVYDNSDNNFKIDYYKITWDVRDLLTNAALSDLAVIEVKTADPNFIQWQEVGVTTTPPRVQPTPFGSWLATWSKTGYGNAGQVVTADQDRSYQLFMETSAVHIWRAVSDFSYNPDTNTLDVVSFLERDGSVITGVVRLDVKFFDGSTLIHTLTAIAATEPQKFTSAGVIVQQWASTGLVASKVYAVVTSAEIGTGGVFNSPTSFSITETKKLDDLEAFVAGRLDKDLSEVETSVGGVVQTKLDAQKLSIDSKLDEQKTSIDTKLDAQKTSLEGKLDAQTTAINTALNNFTLSVAASIVSLEKAANNSLASAAVLEDAAELSKDAALNLEEIGKRQAAELLIPQSVVTGEDVQLRYRGYTTGLIPLIDVLDDANFPLLQAVPMVEYPDNPGIYGIVIKNLDAAVYKPGTLFTVIVTESTTGSIESGAIFVEKAVGQLLMPASVLLGDKLNIRYRGRPDWKPVIKIIDFENVIVVDNEKMTKIKDELDLFEYTINEITADVYIPGKPITVTITEELTSASATGTVLVESTSLSSLEGLVASGAGQKSIIQETLDAIESVKGTLATGGDISVALEAIRLQLQEIPKEIPQESITVPIISAVDEIREEFLQFTGEEGYNFTTLLEKGLEESATIIDIRETTDVVQGTTEVMQKIVEQQLGGEDAPVVHSFFH